MRYLSTVFVCFVFSIHRNCLTSEKTNTHCFTGVLEFQIIALPTAHFDVGPISPIAPRYVRHCTYYTRTLDRWHFPRVGAENKSFSRQMSNILAADDLCSVRRQYNTRARGRGAYRRRHWPFRLLATRNIRHVSAGIRAQRAYDQYVLVYNPANDICNVFRRDRIERRPETTPRLG